jgi:hypothetical protein
MAIRSSAQESGRIVTNGLILYLDAFNPSSLSGSDSTWYDLSNNSNHFTLYNSPPHLGNALKFNGTTQYGQCVNNTFGNFGTGSFTVEYAYNVSSSIAYGPIIMKKASMINNTTLYNQPGWGFNPGAAAFIMAPTGAFGVDFTLNNTLLSNVHITHVMERNGISITGSTYQNGQLLTTLSTTFDLNNSIDNTITASIMYTAGENGYRSGSLYLIRTYNRNLSTEEVSQNFNATRARFGL